MNGTILFGSGRYNLYIMAMDFALTFDDVLLRPGASKVVPGRTSLKGRFSRNIDLSIPLVSAAMDTVTEGDMAIALSRLGGIGVIHRNLRPEQQAEEVSKVKKFESGMVACPVTIKPRQTLAEAVELTKKYGISGILVVGDEDGRLVGILTRRDMRFAEDLQTEVKELMTKDDLITIGENADRAQARRLLHKHRIEKLPVVDANGNCVGLFTVKDMEKEESNPLSNKDASGRLRVAAAIGTGDAELARAEALVAAEVDALVVDTAHGHSAAVLETVRQARRLGNSFDIVAGNVATADAAAALISCGADAVKVGIGPGSICTTRVIAGVGVPQLTAIFDTAEVCNKEKVPLIADGGIRYSGDIAKALAAGAASAMIGSLLAGLDESPGEVFLYQGRAYKSYRGMGSIAAMAQGGADRYFQESNGRISKLVPEGVEGRVPYKGSVETLVHQLMGGLRSAMGYVGAANLRELKAKAKFCRISPASLRESHVHDVSVTREAPNYPPPK